LITTDLLLNIQTGANNSAVSLLHSMKILQYHFKLNSFESHFSSSPAINLSVKSINSIVIIFSNLHLKFHIILSLVYILCIYNYVLSTFECPFKIPRHLLSAIPLIVRPGLSKTRAHTRGPNQFSSLSYCSCTMTSTQPCQNYCYHMLLV
jgi:hypothetical protein